MSHIVLRVYGILINEEKQVLVSDEWIRGDYFTKFPGGGLEFGEGTKECLVREFQEEMKLKIEVKEHIYTTDFFQQSAFNEKHQIVSVYYRVNPIEPIQVPLREKPFEFDEEQVKIYEALKQIESFRFIDWPHFSGEKMSLPIDKIVADFLKANY
jgi:ADP-ribose pyrophosphatase YjhB (NUDIX family)